jgi:hypothetical protein
MADISLEQETIREDRIRKRAYHLWEAEGRPHGRDHEFWLQACAQIEREEQENGGTRAGWHEAADSADATDETTVRLTAGPGAGAAYGRTHADAPSGQTAGKAARADATAKRAASKAVPKAAGPAGPPVAAAASPAPRKRKPAASSAPKKPR